MVEKRYIAALDLGDSTLRLAVATCDDEGLVSLIALVERPSQGVKRGRIDNIALVCQTIKELLEELQEEYCLQVKSLYAGISGEFIRCARHSDHVFVVNPQSGVSHSDVEALSDRMANVQSPEGEVIMERFAQNYMVDGVTEVKNPVGSFGRKLSSVYNFILCQQTPAQRVDLALKNCGVSLDASHSNALVLCDAVATPDERREGVVVVDMGSEVTDIAICQHNVVRYVASIPLGSNSINADIKYMMIPERYIEQLKCEFGNAVSDLTDIKRTVKVPGRTPREDKRILLRNLSMAIEARALDIAEFIRSEIRHASYEGRVPYLVLTGGSAKLTNLDELMHRTTGLDVRVGYPINGFDEESQMRLSLPDYSTIAGLLIKSAAHGSSTVVELPSKTESSPLQLVEEVIDEKSSADNSVIDQTLPELDKIESVQTPIVPPRAVEQSEPTSEPTPEPETKPTPEEPINQVDTSTTQEPQSQEYYEDEEEDDDDKPKRGIKGLFGKLANSINRSFGGDDNEDV